MVSRNFLLLKSNKSEVTFKITTETLNDINGQKYEFYFKKGLILTVCHVLLEWICTGNILEKSVNFNSLTPNELRHVCLKLLQRFDSAKGFLHRRHKLIRQDPHTDTRTFHLLLKRFRFQDAL